MESMSIILPDELITLHRNGGEPLLKAYTEMRDVAKARMNEAKGQYDALWNSGAERSLCENAFRRAMILQVLYFYYDTVVDYFDVYEQMMKEVLDVDFPAKEAL